MFLKLLLALALLAPLQADDPIAAYREGAIERWESDIQALESLDKQQVDPVHAILYIGSSSIRLWEDIDTDMAPWPAIRRGYGGARFSDLAVFVERLVKPHRFDAVAIFVANDITGGEQDKTPGEVLRLVRYIVGKIHEVNADAPVFLIETTPTSARFKVWDEIQKANALIADYCRSEPNVHFIATADKYLDESGMPNDSLFRDDKLHQNRDGYRLWSSIIKAEFAKVMKQK